MFPERVPDREKYIEDQVVAGNFDAMWTEIVHINNEHELKLFVMEDALKVDGVRVNVSANLSQRLADLFDASLPTAQVSDIMYLCASRRATPCPMPISTSVASMVKHSQNVGKLIDGTSGLASTVGKHWVLDKQLEGTKTKACNYGWHFSGSSFQGITGFKSASTVVSGVKVIQPNATAHDIFHSDYSQTCQLVSQICLVDGQQRRFEELLVDPQLHFLVSHQGPLTITRQPGVSPVTGRSVLFPTDILSS